MAQRACSIVALVAFVVSVAACSSQPVAYPQEDAAMEPPIDLATPPGIDEGGCVPRCAQPTPFCDPQGRCVACLQDADCQPSFVCRNSASGNSCVPGCVDDSRCPPGRNCCGGACLDTSSDANNCGGCGTVCSFPQSQAACVAGGCRIGACVPGWGDCNQDPADGCEVNLRVDEKNCTACGKACTFANAVAGCAHGCFLVACQYGYDDCNADDSDGCETAVASDLRNCGSCGTNCGAPPHAQAQCTDGACLLQTCSPGYADCNNAFKDGCEVIVATDAKNCGGCGNACGPGQVCSNGDCTCGPCNFANAKAACIGKQCVIDTCLQGFADCDRMLGNGCEQNIATDTKNCGVCGNVCAQGLVCVNGGCTCPQCNYPNAKSTCVNMVCAFDSCLAGYGNCDQNAANGCEVDLKGDARNCGTCGTVCGGQTPYCLGGNCTKIALSCAAILQSDPMSKDGAYTIDPDGAGPIAPLQVYCDMTTDGGGWTVVYSSAGGDSEVGMAADTAVAGNPLTYGYSNLTRAVKMALSANSTRSLFKRKMDSAWIRASAALYDANLNTPNSHTHTAVSLTASNGAVAQGYMGYSNLNIAGGGDYGVTMTDGPTCQGNTLNGFDHHSTSYYHLNCGCMRHYLYTYSNNIADGDQQYQINTSLGSWTATQGCSSTEGGGIAFYAAMK